MSKALSTTVFLGPLNATNAKASWYEFPSPEAAERFARRARKAHPERAVIVQETFDFGVQDVNTIGIGDLL